MTIKGMDLKELVLPKKVLGDKRGIYFSAIALSMWDNIHGPKILQVWQSPSTSKEPKDHDKEINPEPNEKGEGNSSCEFCTYQCQSPPSLVQCIIIAFYTHISR